jgi:hypothetical protein
VIVMTSVAAAAGPMAFCAPRLTDVTPAAEGVPEMM